MRSSFALAILLILATAAVLLPPLLAGSDSADGGKGGRVTLGFTVWGMPFENRLFEDGYARRYERINPHVTVDFANHADLDAKYKAWALRGEGPEVMRIRITDYLGYVKMGLLEPLDTSIHDPDFGLSEAEWLDIPAHLREAITIEGRDDGTIFGLPEDNAQYGLYYNKRIFDEHNRLHPEDPVSYPSPAWTWEDLRDTARTLARWENDDPVNGRVTQRGIDFALWSWPFMAFFAQAGGEQWSADGQTCLLNARGENGEGGAGVKTLEFWRALQREDRSYVASFGAETGVGPEVMFANGRTAMLLDGSWRAPWLEVNAPELDFAVSALPRGPREGGRPAVMSGSVMWAISAHAKHKQEAWKFLKWLIAPKQALEYWEVLRVAPPASISVIESDAFRSTRGLPDANGTGWIVPPMPEELFQDRAAWLLYANTPLPGEGGEGGVPGFVPIHPLQADMESEIQKMLERYMNPSNTETAQEVLDRAVSNTHSIMRRAGDG